MFFILFPARLITVPGTRAFPKLLNEYRQETHSWIKGGPGPIMHFFLSLLNKHPLSTWLQGHSMGNDSEKGGLKYYSLAGANTDGFRHR